MEYYLKINETIEKWTQYSFDVMLKLVVPLFSLPTVATSFYKYFSSGHSKASFRLIFPALYEKLQDIFGIFLLILIFLRIPFDWSTPFGYAVVAFLQTSASLCHVDMGVCVMGLYLNYCKLFNSTTIDITENLESVCNNIKYPRANGKFKLMKSFTDIIQFHGETKRFNYSLSSITSIN